MPHDVNGNELKVGDTVKFEGKVTSITEGCETCNMGLESVHADKVADKNWSTNLTVTAGLTELVETAEAADTEAAQPPEAAEEV